MSRNIRNLRSKKTNNEQNNVKLTRKDNEYPLTELSPEPIHYST